MFNQDVDFMLRKSFRHRRNAQILPAYFLSGKHEEKAKTRLGDAADSFAELSDTQGNEQDRRAT